MTTMVTALLVSHDGRRWLPVVLDGLAAQTRPPDRVVAVDTGSTDSSPELLRARLGAPSVLTAPVDAGYGDAVRLGLAAAAAPDGDEHWVWLLHDDSTPAPDALERLLGFAGGCPSASVLGPKLREWPSLRRLLEVGVTISGTGRRETGLESGEYDQGQHDQPRDVLAVNTAGMLVRRHVLDSLGLDPQLPVFGADVDFGWRAARAGHRVVVVPEAVVFHAEASHRGVRRTTRVGRDGARASAVYTLLANGPATTLPLRVVRLLLGTLLRVLGLLLVRAPGEALGELTALASVYLRPGRVLAARRDRRRTATLAHREMRHLLAPAWLPYRHGLDAVGDLGTALANEAGARSEGRRSRTRLLASPVTWVFLGLVVAALVASRGLVGAGTLSGGALLPAPDGAGTWWGDYLTDRHDLGTGSTSPAAPYLLPLAVLGTLLVTKAGLVLDLLFLAAVPLAAWGAYRFLVSVTISRPVSLWGAVAYGVLPVVTGAVQHGRLGTVAASLVLPFLARSAVSLGPGESPDRRTRAAWRTALWLALLVAFTPLAWPMAAVLGAVAVLSARGRWRASAGAVAVPLTASLVLLLPWSVATWSHQGVGSWLFEAGLPVPPTTGAPPWFAVGLAVAAVAALLRPDTRPAVLRAWVVLVLAAATVAVLSHGTFSTEGGAAGRPLWLGFPVVLAHAAAITAAALAAPGLRWRRPVVALVLAAAVLTPVVSVGWWLWTGSGAPLERGPASTLPTYMGESVDDDPAEGVLLVRGSRAAGLSYVLLHRDGARTGDDAVLPTPAAQSRLTRRVQDLATAPDPSDVTALARRGVAYVYAPAPADPALAANLDSLRGLSPASSAGPGARAWQVEATPRGDVLRGDVDRARPWLLAVQGTALVVVAVLAAPSSRARR